MESVIELHGLSQERGGVRRSEVLVRSERIGNLVDEDAACFVSIGWGSVVGGFAGFHERPECRGIVSCQCLEVSEERTEVAMIARGDSRAADGGHALSVSPGVEGFSVVEQANFGLAVKRFPGGHDQWLDLGRLHVAALFSGSCSAGF
jgi:hypothetical protein